MENPMNIPKIHMETDIWRIDALMMAIKMPFPELMYLSPDTLLSSLEGKKKPFNTIMDRCWQQQQEGVADQRKIDYVWLRKNRITIGLYQNEATLDIQLRELGAYSLTLQFHTEHDEKAIHLAGLLNDMNAKNVYVNVKPDAHHRIDTLETLYPNLNVTFVFDNLSSDPTVLSDRKITHQNLPYVSIAGNEGSIKTWWNLTTTIIPGMLTYDLRRLLDTLSGKKSAFNSLMSLYHTQNFPKPRSKVILTPKPIIRVGRDFLQFDLSQPKGHIRLQTGTAHPLELSIQMDETNDMTIKRLLDVRRGMLHQVTIYLPSHISPSEKEILRRQYTESTIREIDPTFKI